MLSYFFIKSAIFSIFINNETLNKILYDKFAPGNLLKLLLYHNKLTL